MRWFLSVRCMGVEGNKGDHRREKHDALSCCASVGYHGSHNRKERVHGSTSRDTEVQRPQASVPRTFAVRMSSRVMRCRIESKREITSVGVARNGELPGDRKIRCRNGGFSTLQAAQKKQEWGLVGRAHHMDPDKGGHTSRHEVWRRHGFGKACEIARRSVLETGSHFRGVSAVDSHPQDYISPMFLCKSSLDVQTSRRT